MIKESHWDRWFIAVHSAIDDASQAKTSRLVISLPI